MTLLVSVADRDDLEDLVRLRSRLFPEMSDAEQEAELEEFLPGPNYRFWLARLDGRTVGYAEASLRPYANGCDSRPVPFLEGVWVDPTCRSRHIGQALVAAIEAWAIERGFHELGSDVDISNLISQAAHQAWGFEERETVVYYRRLLSPKSE
ncbi:MAG: cryptic aminoglycoside N-acetyltransferase AAC(6')-Iy/Iaa [Rhodospirillales bacterium]